MCLQVVKSQNIQTARLALQSSELAPTAPHPQASACPTHFGSGGGHTRLRERGRGEPMGANSDEGTDTLVL